MPLSLKIMTTAWFTLILFLVVEGMNPWYNTAVHKVVKFGQYASGVVITLSSLTFVLTFVWSL